MSHIHAANKERKREKLIVGMIVYLLLDREKKKKKIDDCDEHLSADAQLEMQRKDK